MACRLGCGKVRHLHTPTLWIQRAVRDKQVEILKTPGKKNPADLGTKHLPGSEIWGHMARMGVHRLEGKSNIALQAAVPAA